MIGFYVYAKRPGGAPRPLAGPVATRSQATALIERAREVGIAHHYVSPHSEVVYAGPTGPSAAGRFGLLNELLCLPTRRTVPAEA